jgi:GAF domain-containing protein
VIPRRFAGEGVGNFTSLVVDPALDVQSLVAVPIKKLDGTMLGVVMVLNKRGDSFDSTDARLLRLHCQQVIVTMSGPWQLGKLKSAAQPIVGGQAMSPPKAGEEGGRKVVHETVGEALKRTKRLVGCEEALLLRVEGNVLRLRSPPIKVPMTDPLMGYVASTGVCITMSDAEADSRFSLSLKNALGVKTRNLMCVPVLLEGSITGVLLCLNKINSKINSQDFTHQDETIASVLAKQVGATCSAHGLAERRVMRLQTQMQSCTRPPGFQGNWVGMPHDMDALEEIATAVHV